jgi:hypothetical protein
MYIPEGTLFIILAGLVGFAFSGLLDALGLFIWIVGGTLALNYVGGPYAVFGVIIAASLVVQAAPYCSRWWKPRRDARLKTYYIRTGAPKRDVGKKHLGVALATAGSLIAIGFVVGSR